MTVIHVLVRLGLSAESVSHSAVFFSQNKSASSTFCHGLSAIPVYIVAIVLQSHTDTKVMFSSIIDHICDVVRVNVQSRCENMES